MRTLRLDSIKTRSALHEVADNWYKRTHNLRMVWQNEQETEQRKTKAFALFLLMSKRLHSILLILNKLDGEMIGKNFVKGAIISGPYAKNP